MSGQYETTNWYPLIKKYSFTADINFSTEYLYKDKLHSKCVPQVTELCNGLVVKEALSVCYDKESHFKILIYFLIK